jgi:hypothetical protein
MYWTRSIKFNHPKTEISLIIFEYEIGPHEEQTPSAFFTDLPVNVVHGNNHAWRII